MDMLFCGVALEKLTAAHIGGNISIYSMSAWHCMHGGLLGVNRPREHQRSSCRVFMLNWVVNEHVFCEEDLGNQKITFPRGDNGAQPGLQERKRCCSFESPIHRTE